MTTGPPTNTTSGADASDSPLGQHVVELGVARPVEHDAERALVAVLEHEHDGAVEVRVDEGRRRDQQAAAQRCIRHEVIARRLALGSANVSVGSDALAAFSDIVGGANVQSDPEIVAAHVVDWTGRFRGATPAVVRPGSVDEVAAVLRLCSDRRIAVVPQGGNTGLVGGSVPLHGELVLDLRRLDALAPVDPRRDR